MPLSLDDLRPCDACDGPLKAGVFYPIDVDLAVVDPQAVRDVEGIRSILGGKPGSYTIAKALSPSFERGVVLLSEQEGPGAEKTRLLLCQDCYVEKLGVPISKVHEREERAKREREEVPEGALDTPEGDDGGGEASPRGSAPPSSSPRFRRRGEDKP